MDEQKKTSGSGAERCALGVLPSCPAILSGIETPCGALCPGELQLGGSAQLLCHPERPLTRSLLRANPEWEPVGRTRTRVSRHLGGKAGRLPTRRWRTAGGGLWTRSQEILLPVCRNAKGVPGSHPGVEGPGVGVKASRSRAPTPLSWPGEFLSAIRHDGPEGERKYLPNNMRWSHRVTNARWHIVAPSHLLLRLHSQKWDIQIHLEQAEIIHRIWGVVYPVSM